MAVLEGNSNRKDSEVVLDLCRNCELSMLRWGRTTLVNCRNISDEIFTYFRFRILEEFLISASVFSGITGIRCFIIGPRESHIQGVRRFTHGLEMERCYARRYERQANSSGCTSFRCQCSHLQGFRVEISGQLPVLRIYGTDHRSRRGVPTNSPVSTA